jgi:hypothetical protein
LQRRTAGPPDFAKEVGVAKLKLLMSFGYSRNQICCKQSTANNGCPNDAAAKALLVDHFIAFDCAVGLSDSWSTNVRYHLDEIEHGREA